MSETTREAGAVMSELSDVSGGPDILREADAVREAAIAEQQYNEGLARARSLATELSDTTALDAALELLKSNPPNTPEEYERAGAIYLLKAQQDKDARGINTLTGGVQSYDTHKGLDNSTADDGPDTGDVTPTESIKLGSLSRSERSRILKEHRRRTAYTRIHPGNVTALASVTAQSEESKLPQHVVDAWKPAQEAIKQQEAEESLAAIRRLHDAQTTESEKIARGDAMPTYGESLKKIEPIPSMSTDNSASGESIGSRTSIPNPTDISPGSRQKMEDHQYTSLLSRVPRLKDDERGTTAIPSMTNDNTTPEGRLRDFSPIPETPQGSLEEEKKVTTDLAGVEPINMGAYDNDNSRKPELGTPTEEAVNAQAEKLEKKSRRLDKKGIVARAIAGSILPIVGAWTMIDKPQDTISESAPLPKPTEVVSVTPESTSTEKVIEQVKEAGQSITIPEGGSYSAEIAKLSASDMLMSTDEFNEQIYTGHPERLSALALMNLELLANNNSVTEDEVFSVIERAYQHDEAAEQQLRSWLDLVHPGDQVLVFSLENLDMLSKHVATVWGKGPSEVQSMLGELRSAYRIASDDELTRQRAGHASEMAPDLTLEPPLENAVQGDGTTAIATENVSASNSGGEAAAAEEKPEEKKSGWLKRLIGG